MKTTSFVLFVSALCSGLALAAENDPAARQLQIYPKNLARQHMGSNLFIFKSTNQTYVPTEAAAAWLDEDITTGWPMLAGKQHYLMAFAEPELVSNISVSSRPATGTISLYAGDEPAAPGARTWVPLAQEVPFNSINEKKLAKPFTRFAKYVLIETDLADPGPLYSLYLYGEKPASVYTLRRREQPIDSRAIFGQFVNKTTFNANGIYAQGTVSSANSPEGHLGWQKAIDDNPETGIAISGSTSESGAVIQYGSAQSISRIALLTDGTAKGKLEFFAISDAAAGNSAPASLDGRTPIASLIMDGSTTRSSVDFRAVDATALALRWSPVVPSENLTIREIASFGNTSLDEYEVGLKADAVIAYGTGRGTRGDGKESKEIAEGPGDGKEGKEPPEVSDFRSGSPYLPGALGFPPNLDARSVGFRRAANRPRNPNSPPDEPPPPSIVDLSK